MECVWFVRGHLYELSGAADPVVNLTGSLSFYMCKLVQDFSSFR